MELGWQLGRDCSPKGLVPDKIVDHRTWVMCGDGDLMEGISHEAASLADERGYQSLWFSMMTTKFPSTGDTNLSSQMMCCWFSAYGWQTAQADGHDPDSIAQAVDSVLAVDASALISCRTTIGLPQTRAGLQDRMERL